MNDHIVATAIRIEHEQETDRVYIVFEITDEQFKKKIKDDWADDVELRLIGKGLTHG